MKLYGMLAAAFVATLASPLAAQAQSIPEGTAHGAYVGYNTAGPVGWVVGGVVGGTIGGIQGVFGVGPSYYEGPGVYRRAIRRDTRTATSAVATPPVKADSASFTPRVACAKRSVASLGAYAKGRPPCDGLPFSVRSIALSRSVTPVH